jgi:DNA-binding SARP family transcriptional activator
VKFPVLFFLIFLNGLTLLGQDELMSGLYFSSHEVNLDKRTSLNLTPDKPYKFSNGFSLEFDVSFRKGDGYYGYIFRIIGDGNTNIDFVSNSVSTSNFWLVIKDHILLSYKWSDLLDAGYDRWLKVRVDIDVKNTKVAISFNGVKQEVVVPEIAGFRYFDINFGACKNSRFLSTDVSPMSLKNVRIYDHRNELLRDWRLSRHGQGTVYDEKSKAEALVNNPVWIMDRHKKWNQLKNFQIPDLLGIANDEDRGRIFLVDKKAVYILQLGTLGIDTLQFAEGSPYYDMLSKQIIYNKYTDELWSYNFLSNKISRFNFQTKKWSFNQSNAPESDFAHNNKLISPHDSSLVSILGYGHYKYKSAVNHFNNKTLQWERFDRSDQIEPRYLSGAGIINNQKMIVFGGYGSKSGRQELSPTFYYDLYSFNLGNFTFKKLWTLPTPSSHFVPCEKLIFFEQSKSFYTLVYNRGQYQTYLRLAQFSLEQPDVQFFEDSIPYRFLDTESEATLIYNKKANELIALTVHNSDISLYSIAYPPLLSDNVFQDYHKRNGLFSKIGIGLFVILLAVTGIYFGAKKKKIKSLSTLHQNFNHQYIDPVPIPERVMKSSVMFLGGFQIYDRKGVNITTSFSPTLKLLFLFVFLHTLKNGKGVLSSKLDEVLWYDKSGDSARNNRNVNISKLRSILHEIGDVDVVNENSFWKITMGNSVFCDYTEIIHLLRKSKSNTLSVSDINKLLALLSFGEFLPSINNEWMDGFKSEFANEIIDVLGSLFTEKDVINNLSLQYHLAASILVYDPFNDEAIARKCSVLYHLGKKGMAKSFYDSFCREYKKAMDMAYTVSFNDIIK